MVLMPAKVLEALEPELLAIPVERVCNAIGAEEHGIAGTEAHGQSFVAGAFE